ncbi:DUF4929 family protein [Myroides phaeus]|uniref:DUF4929 family protein n=1 Tax=Myroides phaeus TaxID=702745 RepID=UPI002DB63C9E|nr:DUF4929 family protein [Myroides phaeus]MEC4116787.1 DUF4929 family protein [Myroides phaeus]
MKKTLQKNIFVLTAFLITINSFFACSTEDNANGEFLGENKIVLIPQTSVFIKDNSTDETVIDIHLVKAVNTTIKLKFALQDNVFENTKLLEIEDPIIEFLPGQKKAQLKVKSTSRKVITKPTYISLVLVENNSTLNLEKHLQFTLQPLSATDELTPKQIELLELYKSKGLDLYSLIGDVEMTGTIYFPGDGNLDALYNKKTIQINGITTFTLSEKATAEKPVLKMTSNAMGLESYLYKLFRDLTIDDLVFWNNQGPYAPPANKNIMELIGLTRESKETFEVMMDDIEIDLNTKEVSYIGKGKDFYGEEITIIPLTYRYSAYERLQQFINDKNPIAIESIENGANINPAAIINNEDIKEDNYENDTWSESTAMLSNDKLSFKFIMGHSQAGGYINITVDYKIK